MIETNDVELVDSYALVDGTISVKILDSHKNVIAKGLYSAPGFDDWKFKKIGFNSISRIRLTCITSDEFMDDVNEKNEYNCAVEPVSLWLIEKNNLLD